MQRFCLRVLFLSTVATIGVAGESVNAGGIAPGVETFFKNHCNDCHAGDAKEGGLSLDRLDSDLTNEATFAVWVRIFDKVSASEMPPADSPQPTSSQRSAFTASIRLPLMDAHNKSKGTVYRRLNRREYQNTMNDIFGTNLDLESTLPEDGRSHEFDNVGESLSISMVQLRRYLDAADATMDAAIAKTVNRPEPTTKQANYAETREGETHIGKAWKQLDDGAVVFFRALGYPSGMLRTANVREPGRYRIRVTGYAYQSTTPITFSIGATTFQRGAEKPTFAYRSVPPGKPTTVEVEAWIERNYMVDLTPWGISDRDNEIRKNGIEGYRGPGLAILNVELTGPLVEKFPGDGHRLLFDGIDRREIEPGDSAQKLKSWYVPKFEVRSTNEQRDVAMVLQRVATAAFRRPTSANDIKRYIDLFLAERETGSSFEDALRTSVAAVFCSPDFLYLQESAGRLDDFSVASRLSYFLTRTSPDTELFDIAQSGRLADSREALLTQTRRLLNSPHAERFVVDFTDAWLNLRDIEFTSPDKSLYPEFDPFLKYSMLQETRQFFATLVAKNAGVRNLVKSDFAMLNNRLAKHYNIDGVADPEIRQVNLPPDSVRGGLLSQASVLKVSANGTNTSPVVRGVWVTERILGHRPPPPPPGIPGVEPDSRGAATLRELLARHRDSDNCRNCHAMIDPPGFAMESFNPIGGWRDNYRSLVQGDRVNVLVNGRNVRYRISQPVDATGQLANGTPFRGFAEFRDLLAQDEDGLARNLITKLLTFATGREMGFSDRQIIDDLVDKSRQQNHGIRSIIELVVTSEIFLNK